MANNIIVKIPKPLQQLCGSQSDLNVSGDTIDDLFKNVAKSHPALIDRMFKDGVLNKFITIYLDGENIKFLYNLKSKVKNDSEVIVELAIAGG